MDADLKEGNRMNAREIYKFFFLIVLSSSAYAEIDDLDLKRKKDDAWEFKKHKAVLYCPQKEEDAGVYIGIRAESERTVDVLSYDRDSYDYRSEEALFLPKKIKIEYLGPDENFFPKYNHELDRETLELKWYWRRLNCVITVSEMKGIIIYIEKKVKEGREKKRIEDQEQLKEQLKRNKI